MSFLLSSWILASSCTVLGNTAGKNVQMRTPKQSEFNSSPQVSADPSLITPSPLPFPTHTRQSYLSSPTPTPTHLSSIDTSTSIEGPLLSQIADESWNATVYMIEGLPEWPDLSWHTPKSLRINNGNNEFFILDVSKGDGSTASHNPAPQYGFSRHYSPDDQYYLTCSDGIEVFHADGDLLLTQLKDRVVENEYVGCIYPVDWAGDSTAVVSVTEEGEVYVIPIDGNPPFKVGKTTAPFDAPECAALKHVQLAFWAPSSDRFALVESIQNCSEMTIVVMNSSGEIESTFTVPLQTPWYGVDWLTEDVLHQIGKYYDNFFYADNGEIMVVWGSDQRASFKQSPNLSPDNRFLVLDHGPEHYGGDGSGGRPPWLHVYTVYDTLGRNEFSLAGSPGNYLDIIGWENDSSRLYFVSRPEDRLSVNDPRTPFGFLVYDPFSHEVEVFFEQVMQAELSPNNTWAFVAYPSRNETGVLGMESGIWSVRGSEIVGVDWISDTIIYRNPAVRFRGDYSLFPAKWSNEGDKVVYVNSNGYVKLLRLNGEIETLGRILFDEYEGIGSVYTITWSPNDDYFLLRKGDTYLIFGNEGSGMRSLKCRPTNERGG
jgi:hypothetical protein